MADTNDRLWADSRQGATRAADGSVAWHPENSSHSEIEPSQTGEISLRAGIPVSGCVELLGFGKAVIEYVRCLCYLTAVLCHEGVARV